jgi:hypothetical protein
MFASLTNWKPTEAEWTEVEKRSEKYLPRKSS